MKAFFARAKDDQRVIKIIPEDSNEELLLENFTNESGTTCFVIVQPDLTVLFSPQEPD